LSIFSSEIIPMARMKIFSASEEEAFESPPVFTSGERKRFFALPAALSDSARALRTPTNRVRFLLAAGYFKARHKFFLRQYHAADLDFVAAQLGVSAADVSVEVHPRETYARQQRLILNYFGFVPFDARAKGRIVEDIKRLVAVQVRPRTVLLETIDALTAKKIEIPSYNVLADLVVVALEQRQDALGDIIDDSLTPSQRQKLDALLAKAGVDGAEDGWRYRLTLLKKPLQSPRPAKIKATLLDQQALQALYLDLQPVIARLKLSYGSIRYYAYSVIKSQIPQVSRRSAADRYLHLIAFVVYQTYKVNDTLIDILLGAVQATLNTVDKELRETYFEEREKRHQSFSSLVDSLRQNVRATLSAIKRIVADDRLTDRQKVRLIDSELNPKDAKRGQLELQFDAFEQNAAKLNEGPDRLALLEARSLKLQHRVAGIVLQVEFAPNCSKPGLTEALAQYRHKGGVPDRTSTVEFLGAGERGALTDGSGKFRVSLYKVLLYVEIADAIKSGALNLLHSEKYRSLDDYLIPRADWVANRADYLARAQLKGMANCRATLDSIDRRLDAQYRRVNRRLAAGDNPHLTMRPNGSFHVKTPKLEDVESLSLGFFFPERKYIPLLEALATVDQATHFLGEFEHWQIKYRRAKPAPKIFFAGIMGYGCDIGHRKLAQISKQIDENELDNVVNWYFSLENVQRANDRIVRFMDRMELANLYRREEDVLHTSSDGQKLEVAVDSLNANYSFKYLGKEKGVSVITFIDMRDLMWHSMVISPAERESAYVIDGIMRNEAVKSDIHSTDTHGYSEVVFGATYGLVEFAPRIKGVGNQQLYAFQKRKNYEELGYTLLPDRYIQAALIEDQWDEILRFLATIRLKVTSASQLFKRLNSYSKQHPLYRGLKEFGRGPKTLFILKYIDDVEFRQAIEKQLNKVETSNKFSKAVSYGHSPEFLQSEKEDQEIAEGCRRLIKNAIICWNYLYLARELERQPDQEHRDALLHAMRHGSVAAYGHFNLHGEFDFSPERMVDSIGFWFPKRSPRKARKIGKAKIS
jgi:TnpA family transposase